MVHDGSDGYLSKRIRAGRLAQHSKPVLREHVLPIKEVDDVLEQWSGWREFVQRPTDDPRVNGKSFDVRKARPGIAPPPERKFVRRHGNASQIEKRAGNSPVQAPVCGTGRD